MKKPFKSLSHLQSKSTSWSQTISTQLKSQLKSPSIEAPSLFKLKGGLNQISFSSYFLLVAENVETQIKRITKPTQGEKFP